MLACKPLGVQPLPIAAVCPPPRPQVAQHPPDIPAEAWVAVLLASNVLRVAICGLLCCAAARWGWRESS